MMTSATSARCCRKRCAQRPGHRRGFTLIQLLVALGILVVLMSLLFPAISRARRSAARARMAMDLSTIATALEAYKADHGSYPPVDVAGSGPFVLAKALVGPGPMVLTGTPVDPFKGAFSSGTSYLKGQFVSSGTDIYGCVAANQNKPLSDSAYWVKIPQNVGLADGADGPGFKLRPPTTPGGKAQGRTYGPYVDPSKGLLGGAMFLADTNGNPILYFPAAAKKPNISANIAAGVPGFIGRFSVTNDKRSLYDPDDSIGAGANAPIVVNIEGVPIEPFRRPGEGNDANAVRRFQAMLGDLDGDGNIGAGENAATTDSFILWSAGPDGVFGPNADPPASATPDELRRWAAEAGRCDDVTSFGTR